MDVAGEVTAQVLFRAGHVNAQRRRDAIKLTESRERDVVIRPVVLAADFAGIDRKAGRTRR